jgi:hypothetical protein
MQNPPPYDSRLLFNPTQNSALLLDRSTEMVIQSAVEGFSALTTQPFARSSVVLVPLHSASADESPVITRVESLEVTGFAPVETSFDLQNQSSPIFLTVRQLTLRTFCPQRNRNLRSKAPRISLEKSLKPVSTPCGSLEQTAQPFHCRTFLWIVTQVPRLLRDSPDIGASA